MVMCSKWLSASNISTALPCTEKKRICFVIGQGFFNFSIIFLILRKNPPIEIISFYSLFHGPSMTFYSWNLYLANYSNYLHKNVLIGKEHCLTFFVVIYQLETRKMPTISVLLNSLESISSNSTNWTWNQHFYGTTIWRCFQARWENSPDCVSCRII